MADFEIVIPKLGESVEEATITKFLVSEGDTIEEDDNLFEVATDKVDSEIPSPVDGVVKKMLHKEGDVVAVGKPVMIIAMEGDEGESVEQTSSDAQEAPATTQEATSPSSSQQTSPPTTSDFSTKSSNKFYSPLVRNIAQKENISLQQLESIQGSGGNGRVNKQDLLNFLNKGGSTTSSSISSTPTPVKPQIAKEDRIIPMDRVRKLIAQAMVDSKRISPHVTAMVEADVTNIVKWRTKNKNEIIEKHGVNLTYLPIFAEAMAKALRDFPEINASVDGDNIIVKKDVNIGIAVALPSGNLIVPVVKDADQKNIIGLANEINTLANKARNNQLSPDDIQGGTFTISNFGSFQNVMGTPIINQPQVAIMAVGTIEKKPAVVQTPDGDAIAIRHKMFLSLTYDHRVVDGMLGGQYLRKVADYLELFDPNTTI